MFRVLAIGNSFSQDAMAYLVQLAASGGVEMEAVNLYIGGCSLATHWENMQSGAEAYERERNGISEGRMTSLAHALDEGGWDAITLQQASHDSGQPESYFPYIGLLAGEVRARAPQAQLWVHQTWAYELDSSHPAFARYGRNQSAMFHALESAYQQAASAIGAPIIPCGSVIQRLRALQPFDYAHGGRSLCRDGFHMDLLYGRYALAAVWYERLTGRDVRETAFTPLTEADEGLLALIRDTAHEVCAGGQG